AVDVAAEFVDAREALAERHANSGERIFGDDRGAGVAGPADVRADVERVTRGLRVCGTCEREENDGGLHGVSRMSARRKPDSTVASRRVLAVFGMMVARPNGSPWSTISAPFASA